MSAELFFAAVKDQMNNPANRLTTARDELARAAMQGILSSLQMMPQADGLFADVARYSYRAADAMLAERAKQDGPVEAKSQQQLAADVWHERARVQELVGLIHRILDQTLVPPSLRSETLKLVGKEQRQPDQQAETPYTHTMLLVFIALQNLLNRYVSLVNSGDAGSWDPEKEKEVIEARAAIELVEKGGVR